MKKKMKQTLELQKKKGDRVYIKWKGYDNSFKNWTDKKDVAQLFLYKMS